MFAKIEDWRGANGNKNHGGKWPKTKRKALNPQEIKYQIQQQ